MSGIAFWFYFGLRWGPASLLTFALAWALLVAGVVADRDLWGLWGGVLAAGAAIAAAGWGARVREGWFEDEEAEHG